MLTEWPLPAVAWQVNTVKLDTAMPSLLSLSLVSVRKGRLSSEQLQLPRLTTLQLVHMQRTDVDWAAMPALQELALYQLKRLRSPDEGSFSRLPCLSLLDLRCYDLQGDGPAVCSAADLLRRAPPSLRSLRVNGRADGDNAAAVAACRGQLTSLRCSGPGILPALGPLPRLEELEVNATAAELTIHHAALQALPRLHKLICSKAVPADEIGGAHWEVSWHAAPGLGGRRRQRWRCLWLPCPQLHYIGHLCQ